MSSSLTVVRGGMPLPDPAQGETVVRDSDFVGMVKSGRVLSSLRRFDQSRLLVPRIESAGRPLPIALVLRLMTRGGVHIEDGRGRSRVIDAGTLADWIVQVTREPFEKRSLLRRVGDEVGELEQAGARRQTPAVDLSKPALYLRSDLSFGVRAGGSVGHIAGVLNQLGEFTARPIFVTTDEIATVDPGIVQHLVAPPDAFWNFRELPSFALNERMHAEAHRALHGRAPAFVYQRYSVNNCTGVRLAQELSVPLVIEYNGSEVWMSRHWGRPLRYEALSSRIELLNLRAADLVVVVSRPMRDEIVGRGVAAARVLVNPNGVDPVRYSPDVDGSGIRARYGLQQATVVGFIGTFGPWHGAEVLAEAWTRLHASGLQNARLLLIGDGARLQETRQIIERAGALDSAVFTGLVPQEEGAACLAACDVLVSPHVPNPDGTPFFGSPTKLFEYMAMGRGIVASRLDQIGEVLEDRGTALLVPPGDAGALAAGILELVRDRALRERLGADARRVVLDRYTWRAHTRRTIDALLAS